MSSRKSNLSFSRRQSKASSTGQGKAPKQEDIMYKVDTETLANQKFQSMLSENIAEEVKKAKPLLTANKKYEDISKGKKELEERLLNKFNWTIKDYDYEFPSLGTETGKLESLYREVARWNAPVPDGSNTPRVGSKIQL